MSATSQSATGAGPRIASVAGVVALAGGYFLVHALIRLAASPNLGEDDPFSNILAQELRAGYLPKQPPLYEWLLWALQHVTGPGLAGFLLLKYALVLGAIVLVFLAARRVLGDPAWALLTVEALALIYSLSWRLHEGYTHLALALLCASAAGYLLIRILQEGRRSDYLWLGLACGAGLLSQHTFAIAPVSMLAAACLERELRRSLWWPGIVLSTLVALIVAAPFIAWLLAEPARLYNVVELSDLELAIPRWRRMAGGAFDGLTQPFLFLSPLILILPVVFPGYLGGLVREAKGTAQPEALARLLRNAALIGLALLAAVALADRAYRYAVLHLAPIFILTPIWLMDVARRLPDAASRTRRFVATAAGVALLAFVARLANLFLLEPFCSTCRWAIPYEILAREMVARGFTEGTLAAFEHDLAGNLRRLFPEARIVTRRWPAYEPLARKDETARARAFVWSGRFGDDEAQTWLGPLLPPGRTIAAAETIQIPWRHPIKGPGYRMSSYRLIVVPPEARHPLPRAD